MGIFGSFKRANEVWDKSEKEVKGARKRGSKDEVKAKRDQKNAGKK
jgi:hypothetical protein